jgi:hypothetical protein
LDDTDNIKSLTQNSFPFFKEKETVLAILWKILRDEIQQKFNVKRSRDTIIASVLFEYCLIIDDISSITPTTKK